MDWNDMKGRAKKVRAPEIDVMSKARVHTMDDLITLLKRADAAQAKQLRRGMVLFAIAGFFLALPFLLSVILPGGDIVPDRTLHTGLLALLYLGIAVTAWRVWRRFAGVDYAGPVRVFLEEAEKRYRLFTAKDVLATLPLLLVLLLAIYTGGVYIAGVATRYLGSGSEPLGIAIYGVVIASAVIVGMVATRADWRKRKAPVWEEIQRMMAELSAEERNAIGAPPE